MRSVQTSFLRLKDTFEYEEGGERRIVLKMVVLLEKLRAEMMWINQIQSVYMPQIERSVFDIMPNYY